MKITKIEDITDGNDESLEWLLSHGAEVNYCSQDFHIRNSPLGFCVESLRCNTALKSPADIISTLQARIKLLLKHGANPHLVYESQFSRVNWLEYARKNKFPPELIKMLELARRVPDESLWLDL